MSGTNFVLIDCLDYRGLHEWASFSMPSLFSLVYFQNVDVMLRRWSKFRNWIITMFLFIICGCISITFLRDLWTGSGRRNIVIGRIMDIILTFHNLFEKYIESKFSVFKICF